MNVFKATLLAGAAVMMMTSASQAVTMTASGGSLSYTGATDYMQQLGFLARFNSDAGTLTAVTFTAGYGFNSTITVSATTSSTGNVSTESAANFQTSNADIRAVLNSLINTIPSVIIGSSELAPVAYDDQGRRSIYNLSAGQTRQYQSNFATSSTTYNVAAGDLSKFYYVAGVNDTVFDIYGQTLTGLNLITSGGNAQASQSTTAFQNISLAYTYEVAAPTPVPEPASLAVLGLGLVGLGAMRRKLG